MDDEFFQQVSYSARRDGGVTVDVPTRKIIDNLDEWIMPRWPDITKIVPESRLEAAVAEFVVSYHDKLSNDEYLGIWRDDDGRYNIDINIHVTSFDDAKKLAQELSIQNGRDIRSAYNPAHDETRYFTDEN